MIGLQIRGLTVILAIAVDVAAIVRGEKKQGVIGKTELVELVEDASEALVDAAQHRGHDGVALISAGIGLFREFSGVGLLVSPGTVDAVLAEVEEESLVAMGLEEFQHFIGEPIGDVLALGAIGDGADLRLSTRFAFEGNSVG